MYVPGRNHQLRRVMLTKTERSSFLPLLEFHRPEVQHPRAHHLPLGFLLSPVRSGLYRQFDRIQLHREHVDPLFEHQLYRAPGHPGDSRT